MHFLPSGRARRVVCVASLAVWVCATASSASAQTSKFERLPRPKFVTLYSIDGISADGSRVVATFRTNPDWFDRPVVWGPAGTIEPLELLPQPRYAGIFSASFRQPISADGSLIGGYCESLDETSGFYVHPPVTWDATGAIRELPSPSLPDGWRFGYVSAVSPNRAYLYGWCSVPGGAMRPFRWTAAGEATLLQNLSGRDAGGSYHMSATSADGTIAVGSDEVYFDQNGSVDARPVRWKADGSVEALPLLGTDIDGHAEGQADLCSADGSVVAGWLERYSSGGAFLSLSYVCWPGDGRVLELPGMAWAMTPDGKTMVGYSGSYGAWGAVRFNLSNGRVVAKKLTDTEFGAISAYDVSDDGRVIVGYGSPRSDHPGALVWVHNKMHTLEDLLASRGVKLPEGWNSLDVIYFCSTDGTVFVGEGTFGTERTAFRVTIPDILVDREAPVFKTLAPIRTFCDPGKTFATIELKTPSATDDFPGKVVVTTKAGPRFPIGTTNVVWTAKDAAGNVARKAQKVIVTNRKPTANAGRDVVVTTRSERGARVVLDGSGSSDPDQHALKFEWNARGVKLAGATTRKPAGAFQVGSTTATLTVTDAGGAKDTDVVRVTVKLKNARKRALGGAANEKFAAAVEAARACDAGAANSTAASGFAFASIAAACGDATGEYVRWEEGQSEADALLSYSELRAIQRTYGEAAARALLSAYAETGDESLLSAYGYAAFGTAYAAADLTDR
jgi:uncharacterized membrane protein